MAGTGRGFDSRRLHLNSDRSRPCRFAQKPRATASRISPRMTRWSEVARVLPDGKPSVRQQLHREVDVPPVHESGLAPRAKRRLPPRCPQRGSPRAAKRRSTPRQRPLALGERSPGSLRRTVAAAPHPGRTIGRRRVSCNGRQLTRACSKSIPPIRVPARPWRAPLRRDPAEQGRTSPDRRRPAPPTRRGSPRRSTRKGAGCTQCRHR